MRVPSSFPAQLRTVSRVDGLAGWPARLRAWVDRGDGAALTVSLLFFRLGRCHPSRRPGLCGREEPRGVPRLRDPLLPHLPGEYLLRPRGGGFQLKPTTYVIPAFSAFGAGVLKCSWDSVCRGSSLVPPRWVARVVLGLYPQLLLTPSEGRGVRPAGGGAAGSCPESRSEASSRRHAAMGLGAGVCPACPAVCLAQLSLRQACPCLSH